MRVIVFLVLLVKYIGNSLQENFSLNPINFEDSRCTEGEIFDVVSLKCMKCPSNSSPTKDRNKHFFHFDLNY